jgi:hypothetical protein
MMSRSGAPRAVALFPSLAGGAAVLSGVCAVLALSCSSTTNTRIGIDAPPFSDQSFGPLGDYLDHRCGSLDCHGQPGRNLRIWGCEGMRLDAGMIPVCNRTVPGGGRTSTAEHEATYRSLVGLEPQVMTEVYGGCAGQVAEAGVALYPPGSSCHPELLTFVQKARGAEAHKGKQLICITPPCPPGVPNPNYPLQTSNGTVMADPQDVCIVSWLEGATNVNACQQAESIPTYPMDASTE